jgi:hypothetical protein
MCSLSRVPLISCSQRRTFSGKIKFIQARHEKAAAFAPPPFREPTRPPLRTLARTVRHRRHPANSN